MFCEIGSNCVWEWATGLQNLIYVQSNVFLFIPSAQFNCHLSFLEQCSYTLAQNALKVTSYMNIEQLFSVALVTYCALLVWYWKGALRLPNYTSGREDKLTGLHPSIVTASCLFRSRCQKCTMYMYLFFDIK